jgi:hypothetical protein
VTSGRLCYVTQDADLDARSSFDGGCRFGRPHRLTFRREFCVGIPHDSRLVSAAALALTRATRVGGAAPAATSRVAGESGLHRSTDGPFSG